MKIHEKFNNALYLSQKIAIVKDLENGLTINDLKNGDGIYHKGGRYNLIENYCETNEHICNFLNYILNFSNVKKYCKELINEIKENLKKLPSIVCFCNKNKIWKCNCKLNKEILEITVLFELFLPWWNLQIELYPYIRFDKAIKNMCKYGEELYIDCFNLSNKKIVYAFECFTKDILLDGLKHYKTYASNVATKIIIFIMTISNNTKNNINIDIIEIIFKALIDYSNMGKQKLKLHL